MIYFTLKELCRSSVAEKKKIDNTPSEEVKTNLERLVGFVLDPAREAWGRPIRVNSGYRCPALNKAVGGVKTSQHVLGEAADITTGNPTDNARLLRLMVRLDLPFDQLISEKGGQWLHVSYTSRKPNRRQVLHL